MRPCVGGVFSQLLRLRTISYVNRTREAEWRRLSLIEELESDFHRTHNKQPTGLKFKLSP
jgi:hypothetical protein